MSNVTSAGIEIEVGDERYTLKPLTLEDYEWMELKLKARAIEAGRMSLEAVSPEERPAAMEAVLKHADSIDVFSNIDSLLTPLGITWMMHRMVRKCHPEVSADTVSAWVRDASLMNRIMSQVLLLTGVKKNGRTQTQTATGNGKPRQPRRARS